MLVDELCRLPRALQDHDKAVEAGELAAKLDPARQEEGDRYPLAAELIEKSVLKVGRPLIQQGVLHAPGGAPGVFCPQVPRPTAFRLPISSRLPQRCRFR